MKTSLFRRDDCSLDRLDRSDARANALPAAPKADTYTREALADVVAFAWPELRADALTAMPTAKLKALHDEAVVELTARRAAAAADAVERGERARAAEAQRAYAEKQHAQRQ